MKLTRRFLCAAMLLAFVTGGVDRSAAQARGRAELTQISGHFDIVGSSPDGDSLRFVPADANGWAALKGRPIQSNRRGGAQVRLEGIDALETHFGVEGHPRARQPRDLGDAATNSLLSLLGFEKVDRSASGLVVSSKPSRVPGYLLARSTDAYGRCVGFAFAGTPTRKDGPVPIGSDEIRRSVNHQLLADGVVYPTFYSSLYPEIREIFAAAVKAPRKQRKGVWSKDLTATGLKVTSLDSLQESAYIFPKLYRRLLSYLAASPYDHALTYFVSHLEMRNERVFLLSQKRSTTLAALVEVGDQGLRLRRPLEDLVFQD